VSNASSNIPGDSSRPHWSALDGLRGIAILMVVTCHFYAHSTSDGGGFPIALTAGSYRLPLEWIFRAGSFGVPIFFALSGFLLWYPFAKAIFTGAELPSAKKFYLRRIFRIMPAYLYFFGIFWLATAVFGKNPHGAAPAPANIAVNLAFLSPVASLFDDGISPDFVPGTWSLTPEMWFYAILPLVAVVSRRRSLHVILLGTMLAAGTLYQRSVAGDPRFFVHFNVIGCIHAFAWGMVAAELDLRAYRILSSPLIAYLGVAILCFAAWWNRLVVGIFDQYTQIGLASALLIVSLTSAPSTVKAICDTPLLRFMGKISYSLFLCHVTLAWYVFEVIFAATGVQPGPDRFVLLMTCGLAVCTLISWATYHAVERPWLDKTLVGARIVRYRRAVTGALAAAMLLLATTIVLEDRLPGSMTLFSGPGVQAGVAWLRARHQRLEWSLEHQGEAVMDFDHAGKAEPVLTKDGGRIRVSIPDDYSGKWIAIKAIGIRNPMRPHQPLGMRARVRADNESTQLQLGVYDGRDNGTLPEAATEARDLSYDYAPLSESVPTQLKLNIFPRSRGACEVTIDRWEIYSY
jgi:peptidoglycan/LPS O-acetylase OafA/YrhL